MESDLYNNKDKWKRGYDKFQFVPKPILVEHTPCYDYVLSIMLTHRTSVFGLSVSHGSG